jgi:hypothetical protein
MKANAFTYTLGRGQSNKKTPPWLIRETISKRKILGEIFSIKGQ